MQNKSNNSNVRISNRVNLTSSPTKDRVKENLAKAREDKKLSKNPMAKEFNPESINTGKSLKELMSDSDTSDSSSEEEEETAMEEKNLMIKQMAEMKKNYDNHQKKIKIMEAELDYYKKESIEKDTKINTMVMKIDSMEGKENTMTMSPHKDLTLSNFLRDLELVKTLINVARFEYINKKSYLIQDKMEKDSKKVLMNRFNAREEKKLSEENCQCMVCFQNKMFKLNKKSMKTDISLSLFDMEEMKLSFDPGNFNLKFESNEGSGTKLEIHDMKFKRTPIEINFGRMEKERMNAMAVLKPSMIHMDSKELNITQMINSQCFFYVKMIRDWMMRLEDLNMEEVNKVSEIGETDSNKCFKDFLIESMPKTEKYDISKTFSNREMGCIGNLTMEEEILLMNKIWTKKVYVRINMNDRHDKDNHLSLRPFEHSLEMEAHRLSNPIYREIRFNADYLHNLWKDKLNNNEDLEDSDYVEDFDDELGISNLKIDTSDDEEIPDSIKERMQKLLKAKGKVEEYEQNMKSWRNTSNEISEELLMPEVLMKTTSFFARDVVKENLSNKGMSTSCLDVWVNNYLVSQIFRLNKSHYTPNYYFLSTTSYSEFIMMAFFWNDLMDFSNIVMYSDLNKIHEAKNKLPKYYQHLMRKNVILDVSKDSLPNKLERFSRKLLLSKFNDKNRMTICSLYSFFKLRITMGLMMQIKVKDTTSEWNSSSYNDVRECNLINVNSPGNKDSWYNMMMNRRSELNIPAINSYQASLLDSVDENHQESIRIFNIKSCIELDEVFYKEEMRKIIISVMRLSAVF